MSLDDSQPAMDVSRAEASGDRAIAFGRELVRVHDRLRADLRRLTGELDSYAAGADRPADLRTHCLAFCAALTDHHTGEDATAFPALARRFPELEPVLAGLRDDHRLITGILTRLKELLDTLTPGNADAVRGELAGLAAIMESHFRWEERRIVTALNELTGGPYTGAELFGVSPVG